MSSLTQPCEFAPCNCMVTAVLHTTAYCSEICEARDGTDESADEACACGHSPCDAE